MNTNKTNKADQPAKHSRAARSGAEWHALLVEDLPPDVQAAVREVSPNTAIVRWSELDAAWCGVDGILPLVVSAAVHRAIIRQRRAEPHLGFANGHVWYYLDPESSYCTLADLERNLEGQNRYAGGVSWTVGQHWRFCVELVKLWHQRAPTVSPEGWRFAQATGRDALELCLIKYHDHAEGVMHDLNVGLKRALRACGSSAYDGLEARAESWVQRRLPQLVWSNEAQADACATAVKHFDVRAAWIEMQQFGFPDYFVEECTEGQPPVRPEEVAAFKRIHERGR